MSHQNTQQGRLLQYMMGWRKGASGSAFTDEQIADTDFRAGWDDGKLSVQDAYAQAMRQYGTQLNVLRAEKGEAR